MSRQDPAPVPLLWDMPVIPMTQHPFPNYKSGSKPLHCADLFELNMGRGRKSLLKADQLEFLETRLPQFLAVQPNVLPFWVKVEREWFEIWKVEPELGLPIQNTLIEASGLVEDQEMAIGNAQARVKDIERQDSRVDTRKIIHNWYNNRSQKDKKALNENSSGGGLNEALKELLVNMGSRRDRRKFQKIKIWQKRNLDFVVQALNELDYSLVLQSSDNEETAEVCKVRMTANQKKRQLMQRQKVIKLFGEMSDREQKAVEEDHKTQELQAAVCKVKKAKTPEEFQWYGFSSLDTTQLTGFFCSGLNQVGPMVNKFHSALGDLTGWSMLTLIVGPVPNQGSKIGTQRHSTKHTLDGGNMW
ncbi:hypothetical protein K438DRAFT_1759732 [Mycena galopus ATCC 62051]|nr:hypothetical protein K438DRAFT_1759732 [Mycena galopus ATCC 62051]